MFTNLRKSAQGFFAKLILFFLVAMFALWGIGDVFRGMGEGSGNVATVGNTPVTLLEYKRAMQRMHEEPSRVLGGLINDILIEKEAAAAGLVVGDEDLADFVRGIPEFQGKDGKFDKQIYQAVMENSGRSEARFLSDIRREIAAKLLVGPISSPQVPEETVLAVYRIEEEQRTANLLSIPASAVASKVAAPTEQEIKAYYDAHAKSFLAPEYRALSYIALPLAEVQAKVDVPEEEVRRIYEERKDDFRQPERREVGEMAFDNEQDLKAAGAMLAQGVPFAKVAASAPIINKEKTELGMVTQQKLPQEAAGPVFAAKENTVTMPVMSGFRWHLYHIGKIEAPRASTFEESHAAIADDLAAKGAQETLLKLAKEAEDTLAGGATLAATAEKIGQKVHAIGPLTREGLLADGTKAELPPFDNFLASAFSIPEKDHSQMVQAMDGSYFLVQVDRVVPEHTRALEEVKAQAVKGALDEKTHALLEKTAEGLSEQLRAGKKPEAAMVPVSSGPLKRDSEAIASGTLKGKAIPRSLMGEIFRLRVNETTHAYPAMDGSYLIATLTQITPAPEKADPKLLDELRAEMKTTTAQEIMHQYLDMLRSKYTVTVHAAALGVKNEESGE